MLALEKRVAEIENSIVDPTSKAYVDALLDSLWAIVKEVSVTSLKRNKNVDAFLKRYDYLSRDIEKKRLNINDFSVVQTLGKGAYGEVHLVKSKETKRVFAMKCMSKNEMLKKSDSAFFWEERFIMAHANSDWLVNLHYSFQDSKHLYMVMDFMPGGNMLSLMENESFEFTEDVIQFYAAEAVMAIDAVHSMNFIHRDIKPDNMLLDRHGHLKLTDFGTCIMMDNRGLVRTSTAIGTPDYIAPEVLKSQGNDVSYGREVDWWSLGICFYEMFYGETPFYADSLIGTYSQIMDHEKHLRFPDDYGYSSAAIDIMQRMLSKGETRIGKDGAAPLKAHEFFLSRSWQWDHLHSYPAPFDPNIDSDTDCKHFDSEVDESDSRNEDIFNVSSQFSANQLPFVGFTYSKDTPIFANKGSPSIAPTESMGSEKKFVEAVNKITNLQRVVDTLNDNKSKQNNENITLQRSIALLKHEKKELERRLEQQSELVTRGKSEIEQLSAQLAQVEATQLLRSQSNDKVCDLEREIQDLQSKLNRETTKLQEMTKFASDREKSLTDQNSKIKKLQDENAQLKEAISTKSNEIVQLSNKLSALQTTISHNQERIDALSEELVKQQATEHSLNQEIIDKNSNIHELEKTVNTLTFENNSLQQRYEEASLEMQNQLAAFQLKTTNVSNQDALDEVKAKLEAEYEQKERAALKLQGVEKENASLQFDLESAKSTIERVTKDIEIFKQKMDAANELHKKETEIRRTLEADIASRTHELEILQNKETILSKEISALKESKSTIEEELEKVSNSLTVEQQNVEELREQLEDQITFKDVYEHQIAFLKEEKEDLGKQNAELQVKVSRLTKIKEDLEPAILREADCRRDVEEKLLNTEQSLNMLHIDLEAQKGRYERELGETSRQIAEQGEIIQNTKLEKEEYNNRLRILQEEKIDLEKEKDDLKMKIEQERLQKQKLIQELSTTLQLPVRTPGAAPSSKKAYANASREINSSKRLKDKEGALRRQEQQLINDRNKLNAMKNQQEKQIRELETRIDDLCHDLDQKQLDYSSLKEDYELMRGQFEALQNSSNSSSFNTSMRLNGSGDAGDFLEGVLKVQESLVRDLTSGETSRKGRAGAWQPKLIVLKSRSLYLYHNEEEKEKNKPIQKIDLNNLYVVRSVTVQDVFREKQENIAKIFQLAFAEGETTAASNRDVVERSEWMHRGHVFMEMWYHMQTMCDICYKPLYGKLFPPNALECKYCHRKLHRDEWAVEKEKLPKCMSSSIDTKMMLLMASTKEQKEEWIKRLQSYVKRPTSKSGSMKAAVSSSSLTEEAAPLKVAPSNSPTHAASPNMLRKPSSSSSSSSTDTKSHSLSSVFKFGSKRRSKSHLW